MKIIYFILITIFVLTTNIVNAQLKPTKARVTLKNGDELNGYVKRKKDMLYFSKTKKGERQSIELGDIGKVSFVFKEGYRDYQYLKNERTGKYRLLLPLINGKIKLYKTFERENLSKHNNNSDNSYVLSKDGITYTKIHAFKKDSRAYFKDCNTVIEGINSREYSRLDIADMVIVYNDDCVKILPNKKAIKKKTIVVEPKKEILEKPVIKMVKIVRKKLVINLQPIYFNRDKAEISEKSIIELDKVVKLMHAYPKAYIEVGSHTDSRGIDTYNMVLSKNRAEAVILYVTQQGADASHITGIGYGETQLINNCTNSVKCTETEHEQNRRTEFVIKNPEVLGY